MGWQPEGPLLVNSLVASRKAYPISPSFTNPNNLGQTVTTGRHPVNAVTTERNAGVDKLAPAGYDDTVLDIPGCGSNGTGFQQSRKPGRKPPPLGRDGRTVGALTPGDASQSAPDVRGETGACCGQTTGWYPLRRQNRALPPVSSRTGGAAARRPGERRCKSASVNCNRLAVGHESD